MDRVLLMGGVAVLVAALVAGGRLVARRRLAWLRGRPADVLWAALGALPDGRPTVVAFSTPSCTSCRAAQKPALAALEARAGGRVRVVQVDAAERPEAATAFGVLTVPATVVLDGRGAVLAANQGFASAERLAAQLGLS